MPNTVSTNKTKKQTRPGQASQKGHNHHNRVPAVLQTEPFSKSSFTIHCCGSSGIITKRAKLKLYQTIIRPIVTYACETWILKDTIINKLLVFERKILRKIFGPLNEKGIWRIKTNQELDEIIKHKNIINFIRAQRLSWLGHVERMQGTRMVKAIYSWYPISSRPIGRPKTRWMDDIRKDMQKLKVPNWKTLTQDRRGWKEKLVEKAKTV